jgi:phosphoribosyl-AMP cyclohydrolase
MQGNQQKPGLEDNLNFTPRFDEKGLIPCIVVSNRTGEPLMMAYMNRESLDKTLATGEAHYWSRSRNELWHKGATSGQTQKIVEMNIDCDQDCLLIKVDMPEPEKACHTGRKSCFYRVVENGKLVFKK